MGKNLLVDTNILIDWFHARPWARRLFRMDVYLYCSAVTRKELLTKPGLPDAERKKIINLFHHLRLVPLDADIAEKASILLRKYENRGLRKNDAVIAATAWSKNFILFTRNRKHFEFIREIKVLP